VILCALGDLMLDLIVRIERPLARGDDTPAVTRAGAGGQAANVAAWAAALGAQSRLIAKWGSDTTGKLVAAEVGARRVEVLGPTAPGRNGVVVSIVEPSGERSMLSDRGVATELQPEEIQPEWLVGCDALYVSGYSLLRHPIDEAAISAARTVREQGGLVALDLSTWSTMRDFGAERFAAQAAELEPAVVFATERELEELDDDSIAETIVIKRGPAGAVVRKSGKETVHEARPVDVVDSTGAGDALAAGFLVGGIELGLDAAALCVSKLGAMP
jgi:ribokinase